jgi:hypothetical protein
MKSSVFIILKYYVIIWVLYFLTLAIFPIKSIWDNSEIVFLLTIFYLFITIIISVVTLSFLSKTKNKNYISIYNNNVVITKLVFYTITISILGGLFVLYDKIIYQGIDFSRGPAIARIQWQQSAQLRESFSSVFSVLGNILSSLNIIGLGLLHLHWEIIKKQKRIIFLLFGLIGLFFISYVSGGRSILIMVISSLIGIGAIRKVRCLPFLPMKSARKIYLILIMASALLYSMYIFNERAKMNNIPIEIYAHNWINELGGEETLLYNEIVNKFENSKSIIYLSTVVASYIYHGNWIFQGIIDLNSRSGYSLFRTWVAMLNRLPFISIDMKPYHFSGYFATLPGFIYYDYGFYGIIMGGLIHGILLGISMFFIKKKKTGPISFAFIHFILMTTYLSPIGAAFDFMLSPLLVLGYIFVFIIFRYRNFSWTISHNTYRLINT